MKRSVIKRVILSIVVIAIMLFVVAPASVAFYLTTASGQQTAKRFVTRHLSDALETQIRLDSINVGRRGMALYGLAINDREGTAMLCIDTVEVGISFPALLDKKIVVRKAILHGASATFYKHRPDTAANYQFLADWIKPKSKDKTKKKKSSFILVPDISRAEIRRTSVTWDLLSAPTLPDNAFDANHIHLTGINADMRSDVEEDTVVTRAVLDNLRCTEQVSGAAVDIGALDYSHDHQTTHRTSIRLSNFHAAYKAHYANIHHLQMSAHTDSLKMKSNIAVNIDSLCLHTDNGKPRINKLRPNSGAFDPNHLDATLNACVLIGSIRHDTITASIDHLDVNDRASGLHITGLSAAVTHQKSETTASNLMVKLTETTINIPHCRMTHQGRDLRFDDTQVSGTVVLRDISRPFAPALKNFTTPISFRTTAHGSLDNLMMDNIVVNNADKRLTVTAQGRMANIQDKYKMTIRFHDIVMHARGGIKEQIIGHFAKVIKLKMVRQMKTLGDISFNGTLNVKYKREEVAGMLRCKHAKVRFDFYIDENTKKLHGNLSTDSLNLGSIMGVKKLNPLHIAHVHASVVANTSKRTPEARYTNLHHGRLPIGTMTASIDHARYGLLVFKQITAKMKSDGVEARGSVEAINSFFDADLDFIYKQTDLEQSLKTKPKVKLHKRNKDKKNKDKSNTNDTDKKKSKKEDKEKKKSKTKNTDKK